MLGFAALNPTYVADAGRKKHGCTTVLNDLLRIIAGEIGSQHGQFRI